MLRKNLRIWREMWQRERDTSRVPAGLEYPGGVRLGIDQGIWMASLDLRHDWL